MKNYTCSFVNTYLLLIILCKSVSLYAKTIYNYDKSYKFSGTTKSIN